MESSTILYSCSYCKGHGHFKSQCLKRITKNPTDNICRDYNRYKHAPCEFSDDERSCLHARSHSCIICRKPGCRAYNHLYGYNLDDRSHNIQTEMVRVVKQISENIKMLWSRIGHINAQIIGITSDLVKLDDAISAPAASYSQSRDTDNYGDNDTQSSSILSSFLSPAITLMAIPVIATNDPP